MHAAVAALSVAALTVCGVALTVGQTEALSASGVEPRGVVARDIAVVPDVPALESEGLDPTQTLAAFGRPVIAPASLAIAVPAYGTVGAFAVDPRTVAAPDAYPLGLTEEEAAKLAASRRFGNGQIPMEYLCSIGSDVLRCDASSAFLDMQEAFEKTFGRKLAVVDGYRSFADQQRVKAHWTSLGRGYMAATPGWSNHGWGLAVDFGGRDGVRGTTEHTWLVNNGPKFGWEWPTHMRGLGGDKYEPWHFEFATTDRNRRGSGPVPSETPTESPTSSPTETSATTDPAPTSSTTTPAPTTSASTTSAPTSPSPTTSIAPTPTSTPTVTPTPSPTQTTEPSEPTTDEPTTDEPTTSGTVTTDPTASETSPTTTGPTTSAPETTGPAATDSPTSTAVPAPQTTAATVSTLAGLFTPAP